METIRVVELRLTKRSVRTHCKMIPIPLPPGIGIYDMLTVKWDRDGHTHTHSILQSHTQHTYLVTMITDPFRDGNGGEGEGRCYHGTNRQFQMVVEEEYHCNLPTRKSTNVLA